MSITNLWQNLQAAGADHSYSVIAVTFIFITVFAYYVTPAARVRLRATCRLFLFSFFLIFVAGFLQSGSSSEIGKTFAAALHGAGHFLAGIAMVNLASIVLFEFILRSVSIETPRIVRDLIVGFGYLVVVFFLLHKADVSISQLVTTSTVITAIIGFSMQDTLGNIMGGLALQLENTMRCGDWIEVDGVAGKVREIRWRHTSIETRNWDTLIIPNSLMMKGKVVLLGRHGEDAPALHRQWIYFNVDFRVPPPEVIAAVNTALNSEPLEFVASEPRPNCVLWDFKESYCQYAVRYWLKDLAADAPADSRVRTIIYFALQRSSIPFAIPASKRFTVQETAERKELIHHKELDRRIEALKNIELFHSFSDGERRTIAERLRYAPFSKGEALTRQGAEAHWLYILTQGSADVFVTSDDGVRTRVSMLKTGEFFGEQSLLTGTPRTTTVIALEDTECYRLDKAAFHDILQSRPEIAEQISNVIAKRRVELESAQENLDAAARARKLRNAENDVLQKLSEFFGLHIGAKGQGA